MKEEETISRRPQKVKARREDLNRRTHAALQGSRRTSESSERKAEAGDSAQRRNRRIVHKQKKENTPVGGAVLPAQLRQRGCRYPGCGGR